MTILKARPLGYAFGVLSCALFAAGCMTLGPMRKPGGAAPVAPAPTGTPTVEDLVGHLNRTAAPIQALDSRDLAIEGRQGLQSIGLAGSLHCEKPKNFRLLAKAAGHMEADFSSNDPEFW